MKGEFKQLRLAKNETLPPCPLCGSELELWEIEYLNGFMKAVCCENGDDEAEGTPDECLFYMPSRSLEQPTRREAIKAFTTKAMPDKKQFTKVGG